MSILISAMPKAYVMPPKAKTFGEPYLSDKPPKNGWVKPQTTFCIVR